MTRLEGAAGTLGAHAAGPLEAALRSPLGGHVVEPSRRPRWRLRCRPCRQEVASWSPPGYCTGDPTTGRAATLPGALPGCRPRRQPAWRTWKTVRRGMHLEKPNLNAYV
jgi:hypothetical protein